MPDVGVLDILGSEGTGKSALAWHLAEQAHQRGRLVVAFGFPERTRKVLPAWVKHATSLEELERFHGALIIVDEAVKKANARRSQSRENVGHMQLAPLTRQRHQLVIYINQDSMQLDVALVRRLKVALFKEPTEMDIRSARDIMAQEVREAAQAFMAVKGNRKRWTYAVDYRLPKRVGFLPNPLPSFWTDKLSEAFAAAELEGLRPEKEGKQ